MLRHLGILNALIFVILSLIRPQMGLCESENSGHADGGDGYRVPVVRVGRGVTYRDSTESVVKTVSVVTTVSNTKTPTTTSTPRAPARGRGNEVTAVPNLLNFSEVFAGNLALDPSLLNEKLGRMKVEREVNGKGFGLGQIRSLDETAFREAASIAFSQNASPNQQLIVAKSLIAKLDEKNLLSEDKTKLRALATAFALSASRTNPQDTDLVRFLSTIDPNQRQKARSIWNSMQKDLKKKNDELLADAKEPSGDNFKKRIEEAAKLDSKKLEALSSTNESRMDQLGAQRSSLINQVNNAERDVKKKKPQAKAQLAEAKRQLKVTERALAVRERLKDVYSEAKEKKEAAERATASTRQGSTTNASSTTTTQSSQNNENVHDSGPDRLYGTDVLPEE